MLSERLNKLEVGFYIKFFAFNSTLTSMRGHSMLIKKIAANQYSFFDPNHGEDQNLDIDDLAAQINRSTKENHANKMVFLDAREFITSYQITKKETYDEEDPGSVPMWG